MTAPTGPRLRVERDGAQSTIVAFAGKAIVVGCAPGCAVQIYGPDISPTQLRLAPDPEAGEITLQADPDGAVVTLNGRPVQEAVVRDGDEIVIGRFRLIVEGDDDDDESTLRPGARPDAADEVTLRPGSRVDGDLEAPAAGGGWAIGVPSGPSLPAALAVGGLATGAPHPEETLRSGISWDDLPPESFPDEIERHFEDQRTAEADFRAGAFWQRQDAWILPMALLAAAVGQGAVLAWAMSLPEPPALTRTASLQTERGETYLRLIMLAAPDPPPVLASIARRKTKRRRASASARPRGAGRSRRKAGGEAGGRARPSGGDRPESSAGDVGRLARALLDRQDDTVELASSGGGPVGAAGGARTAPPPDLSALGSGGAGAGAATPAGRAAGRGAKKGRRSRPAGVVGGMRTERFEVKGALSKKAVAKTIRGGRGKLRDCYAYRRTMGLRRGGRIQLVFTIGRGGRVDKVRSVDFINDAKLDTCVKRVFSKMRFPNPKGGTVDVRYALVFQP